MKKITVACCLLVSLLSLLNPNWKPKSYVLPILPKDEYVAVPLPLPVEYHVVLLDGK